MSHAIERTSPRGEGQKFIGRCTKCGEQGLGMGAALEPCPMDDIASDEAALIAALDGPAESDADMLARLGMDGKLWAEEFHKTAKRLDYPAMDEGWLIGWFCNAIMAGYDTAWNEADRAAQADATKSHVEARKESYLAGVKDGWNLGICRNWAGFVAIFDEARGAQADAGTDEGKGE